MTAPCERADTATATRQEHRGAHRTGPKFLRRECEGWWALETVVGGGGPPSTDQRQLHYRLCGSAVSIRPSSGGVRDLSNGEGIEGMRCDSVVQRRNSIGRGMAETMLA
jgi:hypothetical protein